MRPRRPASTASSTSSARDPHPSPVGQLGVGGPTRIEVANPRRVVQRDRGADGGGVRAQRRVDVLDLQLDCLDDVDGLGPQPGVGGESGERDADASAQLRAVRGLERISQVDEGGGVTQQHLRHPEAHE